MYVFVKEKSIHLKKCCCVAQCDVHMRTCAKMKRTEKANKAV